MGGLGDGVGVAVVVIVGIGIVADVVVARVRYAGKRMAVAVGRWSGRYNRVGGNGWRDQTV